jgi:hypothetical protein
MENLFNNPELLALRRVLRQALPGGGVVLCSPEPLRRAARDFSRTQVVSRAPQPALLYAHRDQDTDGPAIKSLRAVTLPSTVRKSDREQPSRTGLRLRAHMASLPCARQPLQAPREAA